MDLNPNRSRTLSIAALILLAGCGIGQSEEAAPEVAPAAGEVPVFSTGDAEEHALAEQLAFDHVGMNLAFYGLNSVADVRADRITVDELNLAHARLAQNHQGVPVFTGEILVHFDRYGQFRQVTNKLVPHIDVNPTPAYSAAEAVDLAVIGQGIGWGNITNLPEERTELFVLRHGGKDHLVWAVQVERLNGKEDDGMPRIFVDAHSGEVVMQYDNFKTASGSTLYNGTQSFNTTLSGGDYYLEDTTRDVGTYTMNNGTSSIYYLTDADDSWTGSAEAAGVSAHWAAEGLMDMLSVNFGRDGLDGAGGPGYATALDGVTANITSLVNYGRRYNNAGWSGSYMIFGDGDGRNFDPLTTIDITGHEMGHGINESTAGFIYQDDSGAIDESYSDVWGTLLEEYLEGSSSYDWDLGEDCYTPKRSGDALRYMYDPTADGSSTDHYDDRYTGSSDNGGVHWNSGIGNVLFWMVSTGNNHPTYGGTAPSGLGNSTASAIWYRALTTYLSQSSTYPDFATALLTSAEDLYGAASTEYTSVETGLDLVGLVDGGGDTGDTGDTADTGTTGSCSGYDTTYTSSLSGAGDAEYQPSSSGYSASAGTHSACLDGPSGTDYDLYLYQANKRGKWVEKASSTGSSSSESLSYTTSKSGTFVLQVVSHSGSGAYSLHATTP